MRPRDWIGFTALALVWGSTFLWIKIGLEGFTPILIVMGRLLLGALGLVIYLLARGMDFRFTRRQMLILFVLGLTNAAAPFLLIAWAEQFIDSGVASILNSTLPFWSLIIAHFAIPEERITLSRLIGLLIGFVGVVMIIQGRAGELSLQGSLVGPLASLAAALLFAASAVTIRAQLRDLVPAKQAFATILFANLWAGGFLIAQPDAPPLAGEFTPWIAVVWLGLMGVTTGYLLYYGLIEAVGVTRAAMTMYAVPVVGVLLGVIFLREHITPIMLIGMALVIAAIYVVNGNHQLTLKRRKSRAG